MALNTHALRFVKSLGQHVVTVPNLVSRERVSIKGLDNFTFEAHVKVGAGSTSITDRMYVETQSNSDSKIRFACAPTRDKGRSVLIFEFARTDSTFATAYRYEIPNGWDDKWHHVAFSVNIGTSKYAIFFDNVKVKEGTIVGGGIDAKNRPLCITDTIPEQIFIGASKSTSGSGLIYWDGKIDNIRLFRTFINGSTYNSEEHPTYDHATWTTGQAPEPLVEEWRFNEGPQGGSNKITLGVVDHQYDPKTAAQQNKDQDDQSNNSESESTFTVGPPEFAAATLSSERMWIGIDGVEYKNDNNVEILPRDFDRPYLGEGINDETAPSIPLSPTTSDITESSFNMSWEPSIDDIYVQSYTVEVSTVASFSSTVYSKNVGLNLSHEVTGLRPGVRYYWRVASNDAENNQSKWASPNAYRRFQSISNSTRINYSPNPSFEGSEDGGKSSWYAYAEAGTRPEISVSQYAATSTSKPDGDNSIYGEDYLVVSRSSSQTAVVGLNTGVYHQLPWVSGKTMTCSFWAKGSGPISVFAQLLRDYSVKETLPLISITNLSSNSSSTSHQLTSTWTRYSFTFTPSNVAMNSIRLFFVCASTSTFTFNIDGVLIENGTVVASFFDGNSDGDSYWVTLNAQTSNLPTSGYVVETSTSTLSFLNESPSAKNITISDFQILQTKDFTDRTAPNAPTTNMSITSSYDSFVAKWLPPTQNYEDIVAYEIQVGLKSNLSARDTVFVEGYSLLRTYDTTLVDGVYQRVITGLNPSTNYYYRVRAIDQNENISNWSSAGKKVTTTARLDTTSPTAVITDFPDNISFEGFTAKWYASSDDIGVVTYLLTVSTNSTFTNIVTGYNQLSVGNVLEYDVRGLLDNTVYYYRVAARDAAGNTSTYEYAGTEVKTNVRTEQEGGLNTEYIRLPSFSKISKATGQTTTWYGEEASITLDGDTQAVFQFDLNRQIPFGEIKSATLNLRRTSSSSNTMQFKITKLIPIVGDYLGRFYDPETVTYSSITKSSQFKEIEIFQVKPSSDPYDIVVIDITDLVQSGLVSYGFVVELISGTVTVAGTETTVTQQAPEMSFTVDVSKTLQIAVATDASRAKVTRNLFPNPTIDKTSDEFTIPNGSFDLEGTSGWVFNASPITGSSINLVKNEDVSYDTIGGCGQVNINIPSAASNTKMFFATSNYKIPVVSSSADITYKFKMYVSTASTQITPIIFITPVTTSGESLTTVYSQLASFDPSPNVWYQAESSYTLPANTSNVEYLLVGVSAENKESISTPLNTEIKFDAPSITSTDSFSPLNVIKIGSGVTAIKDESQSFDSGYLSSGSSLNLITGSGSGSRGVRFIAESPNESWLTEGAENSTINFVVDPSFETSGLVTSNSSGPITYSGISSAQKTSISGAKGINCLRLQTEVIDWDATNNFPTLPTTSSPNLYRVSVAGTYNSVSYTVGQVLYHNGTSWVEKTSHTETLEIHTTDLPDMEQQLSYYFGSFYIKGQRKYRVEVVPVFGVSGSTTNSNNVRTVVVPDDTWRRVTDGIQGSISGNVTSPFYASVSYDSGDKLQRVKLVISLVYSKTPSQDYENNISSLGNPWFIDAVQIERRSSSSDYPSLYCDGFEDGSFWYGVPNQSISYRNCLVPSVKISPKTEASFNDLVVGSYLELSNDSISYGYSFSVPTVPTTKSGTWVSLRGWPMQLLGVGVNGTYPIRSAIELRTTSNININVDAVSLSHNDGTGIYFNGSSLNASWSAEQFSSISEHSGIDIQSKIYTQGSGYDRARIVSSIKASSVPQMVAQTDESFYYKYNSASRSATVTIPEKIYWNRLSNSSFEQGVSFWDSDNSDIVAKIISDAPNGAIIGRWKTSTSVPETSVLFYDEPLRVYPNQMWSFQIQARPYNSQRNDNYKVRCGIAYYGSNNTVIGSVFAEDYAHCYDYELINNKWQVMFVQSIVPEGAYWARPFVANPPVGLSTGLLSGEFVDFDAAMMYSGPALRQYFDGTENENFFWEGRAHRSPTIFVIRSNSEYTINHSTANADLFNIGNSSESIIRTAVESADFVEFLFNEYQKRVGPNFIEITIPYRGQNTQRATLSSTSRRVDSYSRSPVSISVDEQKKIVVLRSEGLAQNREYIFEIDVVAPDTKRVRGDNKFVASIVSGTRNEESLTSNEGDGTIEFGGFVLNGPKSKYYYVTEHDSFSLPERRNQIEIIPRSDGGVELQSYWGKKVISISGGVWGDSRNHLYDNVNALRAALSTKRQKLRIDTLANNNDYYWATCTSFNTQEVAGDNIASLQWTAKFECADPFLYRGDEKVSSFKILSSKPANTVDLFYTDDQTFTVNNTGSIYSMPKLNVGVSQGQGEYSVAILNETTGERIVPKSIITINDKINIDSANQTVTKNGTVNLDYVGTFPRLVPGANNLKVSIRDLKANRHNLLLNPGVELDAQVGISRSYILQSQNSVSSPFAKQFHDGVSIQRTRFQSASNSNYAALVSCDRLLANQGVSFLTKTSMYSGEFAANPTKSRQFSAAAYLKTDDSALEINKCFIRIWYNDGTKDDQESAATQRYRINSEWKLIKLPSLTSSSKTIDYIEVLFLFSQTSRQASTFLIDNVYLIESTLSVDQADASFDLSVSHQERFI